MGDGNYSLFDSQGKIVTVGVLQFSFNVNGSDA